MDKIILKKIIKDCCENKKVFLCWVEDWKKETIITIKVKENKINMDGILCVLGHSTVGYTYFFENYMIYEGKQILYSSLMVCGKVWNFHKNRKSKYEYPSFTSYESDIILLNKNSIVFFESK